MRCFLSLHPRIVLLFYFYYNEQGKQRINMRWTTARKTNRCTGCSGEIKIDSQYLSNSSSAFCNKCGLEKENKELQYSRNSKSYTDIRNNTLCYKCKQVSIGHLMGKPTCMDHIGDAVLE